ncbi:hypothetical protein QZJ86_04330 [Methylomonas montana]|uniref:hypothetical protein n=1 Tax=Methylomonas montana TaxID=3058963 RepID=UPI00265A8E66|nr:hypothetical protein [Methylomonas montana]WKJ91363.1 hypothetical protein QZJ86_04330 [Methylomonas montana]
MKNTVNRQVILKYLSEPNADCGAPPYTASDLHYMLEHGYDWHGVDKKPVSISQINRTLRDLYAAGLIVFELKITDTTQNKLPQRVKYWQLAGEVGRNKLINEVNSACRLAGRVHGVMFFGGLIEQPVSEGQKEQVIKNLKAMMQRTHPDKVEGFTDQFKQLQEALAYVRSNIDLTAAPAKQLQG